jgi:hypothetical protein
MYTLGAHVSQQEVVDVFPENAVFGSRDASKGERVVVTAVASCVFPHGKPAISPRISRHNAACHKGSVEADSISIDGAETQQGGLKVGVRGVSKLDAARVIIGGFGVGR